VYDPDLKTFINSETDVASRTDSAYTSDMSGDHKAEATGEVDSTIADAVVTLL